MSVRNQTDCKNTNCGMSVCEPCKCKKYKSSKEMITERELKEKCTPEFIKDLCELAEGFEVSDDGFYFNKNFQSRFIEDVSTSVSLFPLLIYRAVEGWNKKYPQHTILVYSNGLECWSDSDEPPMNLNFNDYQPENLTQAEYAMLHCLLDKFRKQEERDDN